MKIEVWQIGKSKQKIYDPVEEIYLKRLKPIHQISFKSFKEKDHKNLNALQIKNHESQLMIEAFKPKSFVIILDEKGKMYDSPSFAAELINIENKSEFNKLIFCIGGAYGFNDLILQKAHLVLSLSKMTFPHKMIRLFLLEQLYRAHTIKTNHKYHKY